MSSTMTPNQFVSKWRGNQLKERSASQEHFMNLCQMLGHPTPADVDKTGENFTFEAGATKQAGGQGWADVWKKGYFAWEYKGNHKDLDKAYQQLLQYRESLQNPPLLVVADLEQIIIHTNFTNTVKQVFRITLDDLLTPEGLRTLRNVFNDPEAFRAPQTTEHVTQQAAAEFAKLASMLRDRGVEPHQAAHFLIRLLFCLFAEDISLLPKNLFSKIIENTQREPGEFADLLQQLFGAMSKGGRFGYEKIRHFNGGLFDDDTALDLDEKALEILQKVSGLDWSSVEPTVLGTLFERSLDPAKRSQLGAHYTSKQDILLIVEPVLMAPLRRKWEKVKAEALELVKQRDAAGTKQKRDNRQADLRKLLMEFAYEISKVRVLDAACGSGNFLYVSLRQLLDLEKEVITFAGDVGVGTFFPSVSPEQLHGIEINPYAHELAQATIWIGYIQWLNENGFGVPPEPILKPLNTIINMDAILAYDDEGNPVEPEWQQADVIVGNPPFLGGNKIRQELGDSYVESLFVLYKDRVPASADLVCYWFERSRGLVESGRVQRVGLLATNSIRGGVNRRVLDRIKSSGDIFMGWSDRPWILDGAAVRVSMIGFDQGNEIRRFLDGNEVGSINSDLTGSIDLGNAAQLNENDGLTLRRQ